ncbi:DUF547 domain-containing protein [Salinivibrio kushneri]|uniref:DUF547 domain-containing protein n=1 Tax=Salinivibrio kushneri TaxID=1908198 RepID=UPI0009883DFB|nr:DUF547 domain-containing protein [Salinivibrio kushneri]OOE37524.1 hypothetical protein BZG04_03675 [Salinivibrio kushneri]OOE54444.1 hypothetical protein BZG12_06560 [Salinivibrio kushneri]
MQKRLILLFCLVFPLFSQAAPKAEYWAMWDAHNPDSQATFTHHTWQVLLDKYLQPQGQHTLFNYAAVTDADKKALDHYIRMLTARDPRTLTKNEQYAYWVNLYNAVTVTLILEAYPVSSITKLGGLFSFGPWDDEVVTVAGEPLTLNDIEHRILRPLWQDPRTHYAVNCASLGCPNLQPKAFQANALEAQLEQAAYGFINSDKGVSQQGDQWQLSSIYEWFEADFGGDKQGVIDHINQYRDIPLPQEATLEYDYNWDLNQLAD